MDKVSSDRFYRFLLVIRQACLLIAGWVESETNTKGSAMGAMRASTEPTEAPLQFRKLTDEEMDVIADKVAKRITNSMLRTRPPVDTMNV